MTNRVICPSYVNKITVIIDISGMSASGKTCGQMLNALFTNQTGFPDEMNVTSVSTVFKRTHMSLGVDLLTQMSNYVGVGIIWL